MLQQLYVQLILNLKIYFLTFSSSINGGLKSNNYDVMVVDVSALYWPEKFLNLSQMIFNWFWHKIWCIFLLHHNFTQFFCFWPTAKCEHSHGAVWSGENFCEATNRKSFEPIWRNNKPVRILVNCGKCGPEII